jgi:hypothetical protein
MAFTLIDHIRDGGSPDNTTPNDAPNDDWIGVTSHVAVVADGATGLSDERLVAKAESDAQWIAKLGTERFINTDPSAGVRDLVREINTLAARQILADAPSVPRYAWPSASFIMARDQGALIEVSGLGDCVAFVEMEDGRVERFSALPFNRESESRAASADLAARSKGAINIRTDEVIASLRTKRERNNTHQSGVWTLGLVPEAADHIMTIAIPANEVSNILLMSDGFSAAVDAYQLWDDYGLIVAAKSAGLAQINARIRQVERMDDPRAERFPRYKQSDDSTAILVKVGN